MFVDALVRWLSSEVVVASRWGAVVQPQGEGEVVVRKEGNEGVDAFPCLTDVGGTTDKVM